MLFLLVVENKKKKQNWYINMHTNTFNIKMISCVRIFYECVRVFAHVLLIICLCQTMLFETNYTYI